MAWTIEFDERAQHDLAKLDKPVAKRILRFLRDRVAPSQDPRAFGHNLKHQLSGLWRYRVGDYRVLCQIEDKKLIVLVVAIGHRSSVYDGSIDTGYTPLYHRGVCFSTACQTSHGSTS